MLETEPNALSANDVARIRDAILRAEMRGPDGSWQFEGTYTFTMAFRRDGLADVLRRFPAFEPFVDRAMIDDANAFLMNPLVVGGGRAVAKHFDRSLAGFSPTIGCPVVTSVLYVKVPRALRGGAFVLHRPRGRLAVKPAERMLLTFRGDLAHEVQPVRNARATRISLVLEQYRASARDLSRVPRFAMA